MDTTIKAFIFDVGGVLANDMRWDLIESKLKGNVTKEQLSKVISEEWNKMKVDDLYSESTFWKKIGDLAHFSEDTISELRVAIKDSLKINYSTVAIAERLKQHKFVVGIISNHSKFWFDPFMERFSLYEIFDCNLVMPSCDVHCAKPSSQIYELMFSRIKQMFQNNGQTIEPNNVAFIDDKEANVIAANKVGFVGIQFQYDKQDISSLVQAIKHKTSVDVSSMFSTPPQ